MKPDACVPDCPGRQSQGTRDGRIVIEGTVFDIQHFSVHDGPGIRTIVFMKGCPLRCLWCANPESHRMAPEILVNPNACIHCENCLEVCPEGAITLRRSGVVLDRKVCNKCGHCVEVCYPEAVTWRGKRTTAKALMKEINEDRAFYEDSGGGITVSGGEPLLQGAFVAELLNQCRLSGFHTAIETSGFADWADLSSVLRHTDLVLYDLKQMDPVKHIEYTGKSNEIILANARSVAAEKVPMEIRLPLIPGYNDTREHITAALKFVADLRVVDTVSILPFHRMAGIKYRMLGRRYRLENTRPPDPATVAEWADLVRRAGFHAKVGG